MKSRKYLFFSIFIMIICITPVNSANNLTIVNKIYKFVCDIEPLKNPDSRDAAETKQETQEKRNGREESKKLKKRYIALTFDDGPHPEYTGKIIKILSEKKAPATFFIVGNRAELHPVLLQRMKQANCEIGNHTYDHIDLSKINNGDFLDQMEKCNRAIYNATGEYPKIYRPPFGRISKANEQSISHKMSKILWTVDSLDWTTPNKDKIIEKVVNSAKDKSIVLMHDFYSQSVEALPEIIDRLREKGYEFLTVSQLKELSSLPERMEYFVN